jgi:outer membrane protein OmpA-like peptidoglycan-associated protein
VPGVPPGMEPPRQLPADGQPYRRDRGERGDAPRPGFPVERSDSGPSFNQPGSPGYVPGGFSADRDGERNFDAIRRDRREYNVDGRTVIREQGRIIVRDREGLSIRHDESERFREVGGRAFRSERRGQETYSFLDRPNGDQIVTVVDDEGRLLRRSRRFRDGREVVIIDNRLREGRRQDYEEVIRLPPVPHAVPRERYVVEADRSDEGAIYGAFTAEPTAPIGRRYSLDQVRSSPDLRARMPSVDINAITFETASFTVTEDQAPKLSVIAAALNRAIRNNTQEVYLVEGYTDAVGPDIDNLSLSDRRAQSVARVLTDRFGVPPENLTTQGYGEAYLKVNTQEASRENRRVAVRRVTPLIQQEAAGGQPGR